MDEELIDAVREFVREELTGLSKKVETLLATHVRDISANIARVEQDGALAIRETKATLGEVASFVRTIDDDRAARVARTSAAFATEVAGIEHWLDLCISKEAAA